MRRLLAVVATVLFCFTGCGRLDQDAVSTELKGIESGAAEGMLVANEAARSRAPASFIQIRTAELSKVTRNAADALNETPTESGFQEAANRGSEVGHRASELLDSLHSDPGNTNLARNVAAQLKDLSHRAGDLEESL